MLRHRTSHRLAALALCLGFAACEDESPTQPERGPTPTYAVEGFSPPPPAGLVDVEGLQVWPWTTQDLGETTSDPVNLLFKGDVDIASLRAALLALDGNRTGFQMPPIAPFNCTWKDAHGGMQAIYTSGAGWVGNAVQLECGDYGPIRFHLRLYDAGDWVVGAVHFDLLIQGTPQHQVISWELPQQIVTVDFLRSGLADVSAAQLPATAGPVKEIPSFIYGAITGSALNALIPILGLGAPGPTGVPVMSDGWATVVTVNERAPVTAGGVEYALQVPFSQRIPRPFCSSGPADWVRVEGNVDLGVRTSVNAQGRLETHNTLRGDLQVTPVNPVTGEPIGATFPAQISAMDNTSVGPQGTSVNALVQQKALPPGVGFLKTHLLTAPNGSARFTTSEKCD